MFRHAQHCTNNSEARATQSTAAQDNLQVCCLSFGASEAAIQVIAGASANGGRRRCDGASSKQRSMKWLGRGWQPGERRQQQGARLQPPPRHRAAAAASSSLPALGRLPAPALVAAPRWSSGWPQASLGLISGLGLACSLSLRRALFTFACDEGHMNVSCKQSR